MHSNPTAGTGLLFAWIKTAVQKMMWVQKKTTTKPISFPHSSEDIFEGFGVGINLAQHSAPQAGQEATNLPSSLVSAGYKAQGLETHLPLMSQEPLARAIPGPEGHQQFPSLDPGSVSQTLFTLRLSRSSCSDPYSCGQDHHGAIPEHQHPCRDCSFFARTGLGFVRCFSSFHHGHKQWELRAETFCAEESVTHVHSQL